MLSKREKILAGVAGVILVAMVVVGYGQTSLGSANTLVAPTEVKPTPTVEPVKESDTENQQRNIKDNQNWLKNMQRELQDIKKQAKTLDTSAVETLFAQYSSCIQARQAEVGTQDFWNNIQDCQSFQRDIDTQMNDVLRPARDCANTKRSIEDRRKEKKNVESQLKDILRQDKNADVSPLTAIISQIDALFAKADQASAGSVCNSDVRDALNDIQNDFNSLFQDFYSTSNDVRQGTDQVRQLNDNIKDFNNDKKKRCEKDKTRELKNFEKEVARAAKSGAATQETLTKVKDIYNKMCVDDIAAMQKALDAKDTNAYNDARSDYDSLDRDFWDALNESRQGVNEQTQKVEQLKNATRELKRWTSDLKRMKLDLNRTKKTYEKTAKKYANSADRKEQVVAFGAYVTQAGDLVKKIEEGIATAKEEAPKDPESWWFDHQEDLNDLQSEFSDIQQKVQNIGQVMQFLKDIEKQLKGTVREMAQLKRESNNDPELMNALQDILNGANGNVKSIWANVVTDPEGAMETLQSMQDMGNEWNDTVNMWRESKQSDDNGNE